MPSNTRRALINLSSPSSLEQTEKEMVSLAYLNLLQLIETITCFFCTYRTSRSVFGYSVIWKGIATISTGSKFLRLRLQMDTDFAAWHRSRWPGECRFQLSRAAHYPSMKSSQRSWLSSKQPFLRMRCSYSHCLGWDFPVWPGAHHLK